MTGKAARWLSEIFASDWKAFKWQRGVYCMIISLAATVMLAALDEEHYYSGIVFGVEFTAASAPAGPYAYAVRHMAGFALIGALLTAKQPQAAG